MKVAGELRFKKQATNQELIG